MQVSGAQGNRLAGAAPLISVAAIDPENPPDPKDAFSLLVEGATEYAVFALSPTGVVSTWNRGAERIEGYRRDEIVGQHFSVFYPAADREAGVPAQMLRRALDEGRVVASGWRVRRDGGRFWASVVITPLWDDAGRLRGFAKLTRDETDRRAAEVLNEHVARLSEQERIASVLAKSLVRRLFAVGLQLNGALNLAKEPELRRRMEAAVQETDDLTEHVRTAVFGVGPAEQ